MSNKLYEEENVRAIADAIRTKTGDIGTMTLAEMSSKIAAISSTPMVEAISAVIQHVALAVFDGAEAIIETE